MTVGRWMSLLGPRAVVQGSDRVLWSLRNVIINPLAVSMGYLPQGGFWKISVISGIWQVFLWHCRWITLASETVTAPLQTWMAMKHARNVDIRYNFECYSPQWRIQ